MSKDYWLERWDREEIGFHQNEVNPYLRQYWQDLRLAHDSEVFVPLCGKSQDMTWLREQGHSIIGVELSSAAVLAFFHENRYRPHHVDRTEFEQWEANGIRILCGNFFDLSKDDLAKTRAVYDRGALVALPPEMRMRYVSHLLNILAPGAQILLVTFDYPQAEMPGPPFAVSTEEVEALYRARAEIRLLADFDILEQTPRFQERGLCRLQESVFLITTRC